MSESGFNINSVMADAIQVIKKPVGFYQRMPHTGGYLEPMIFLVVMAAAAGLIVTVFSLFSTGLSGMMVFGISAVIILPIVAVISSFIGALIIFVIWKLLGTDKNFETAYRCVAHASAIYPVIAVLGIIPYIGSIVGVIWGMYLMVIASIEVHSIEARKAYIAFGIFGAIMVFANISSEMAARSAQQSMEQMGLQIEDMENKSPEELGKMVGEFMKGLETGQSGGQAQQ